MSKYDFDISVYVYDMLAEFGAMTRGKLALVTGIPRTTLYDNLMKLELAGVVQKTPITNGTRQSPPNKLRGLLGRML